MALEFDLAELITSRCIDNAEPAAPITDVDTPGGSIVSNVVGIIGKFDALDGLERRAVKDFAGATLRVGDKDLVKLRNETNALRLMQFGDAVDTLACTKVQNLYRVVSKRGNE